jgi:lysophospholipase L1-like esterase
VTTYVAMGDSFTAGFEPGKPRWPDELADALGPGVRYENVAVVGATSEQVEREQLPRAVELRPDLVTLVCGANDVLDFTRPDPDAYGVRLSRMFARLRHGARHLGAAGEVSACARGQQAFRGGDGLREQARHEQPRRCAFPYRDARDGG